MPTSDIATKLLRGLRLLTVATIVLYILAAAAIVQTDVALCTLKTDIRHRIESGEDFLTKHPDGIPGITAAALQATIDSQKRSYAALSILPC